jgi:hypothetical protein
MTSVYLIILVLQTLACWTVVSFLIHLGLGRLKTLKKPIISYVEKWKEEAFLERKLEALDLNAEVEPILDEKLDGVIDQYRQQIPMLSMFLTEALTAKVKTTAKLEILKALPDIKSRLITKLGETFNPTQMAEESLAGIQFDKLILRHFKKEIFLVKSGAALFGFFIGLVEVIILKFLA